MPMKYKVDVIATLKEAGYNTSTIRKEKLTVREYIATAIALLASIFIAL